MPDVNITDRLEEVSSKIRMVYDSIDFLAALMISTSVQENEVVSVGCLLQNVAENLENIGDRFDKEIMQMRKESSP